MPKNKLNQAAKITLFLSLLSFFALSLLFAANLKSASGQEQVKQEVFTRQVTGEVAGISKNFIAVIYGQTARESLEMALPMDKSTRARARKLNEIKVGDIVLIAYEETLETKKGEKPKVIKRLAKIVEFRREAALAPPEENVLEGQ